MHPGCGGKPPTYNLVFQLSHTDLHRMGPVPSQIAPGSRQVSDVLVYRQAKTRIDIRNIHSDSNTSCTYCDLVVVKKLGSIVQNPILCMEVNCEGGWRGFGLFQKQLYRPSPVVPRHMATDKKIGEYTITVEKKDWRSANDTK